VEVLPESELEQIVDRIAGSHSIIVVPSFLVQQPLFQRLRELGCEIIVIDD
jgi:DNA-binding MurR/RpiR family transcriptional regulator